MLTFDLYVNAVISGILLGGFYAAVSIGLAISFGLLGVPQVAHPAFLVLGGFGVIVLNRHGVDPLLAGILWVPAFFLFGWLVYSFYHRTFERRGEDADLRGIAFFFGVAFIVEISLSLYFGVDQQFVDAPYIGRSFRLGDFRFPYRMLVACGGAIIISALLAIYLRWTFIGRAIQAVAQNQLALQLVGVDPVQIKKIAFAMSMATTVVSGALLAIVGPISPELGRIYLGKVFAIVVLAGLGSIRGVLVAAVILGVVESIVLAGLGTSWAPAVGFGILLMVLAIRPTGIFGRG